MMFHTTDELMRRRAAHMDNLNRLKKVSPTWKGLDTNRGEATMANLMQQVYDIDAEISMAKARRKANRRNVA